MQLKSIEMVGFKSFADRTTVELKDGITGIVGPNGCGKSNIVDALRWCLGEMSAKSLRSKHMMDVIFAGSANRAPINLSEVTVTFDNSHKLLPIDFTEVQISRRLFRSGESEYFLNKTQCRLKDIRDLLMDSGIGDGYSILAQGEVAFVVNAKPEERRELFEEAAGIAKYKSRREETLRKLEKVDQDLSRLNDIIVMVKEQMGSLETAAKKAKLFQKLKEELKTLEVADFINQVKAADEKILERKGKAEELKNQAQETVTQLDLAESESTQNQLTLDESDRELYRLNSAILELDKQIHTLDQGIQYAEQRAREYAEKREKCEIQISDYDSNVKNTESKIAELDKEISQAKVDAVQLKEAFEKEQAGWEALREARKEIEARKDQYSEALFQMAGEMNGWVNEQNRLSSLSYNKDLDMASARKEFEKAEAEAARLAEQMEQTVQMLATTEGALTGSEGEIAALRGQDQALERKAADLTEQISLARQKIVQYETQLKSLEENFESHPYRRGTQAMLKENFDGCRGVVGIALKYSDHMSSWVESALGSRINHVIFDRQDQAQMALDWLKKNELGRATCVILEKIPETRIRDISQIPNANSMLTFVQCEPALENLKNYLLGGAYLAGSTLYDEGTMDGGSDQMFLKNASSQTSENQFLQRERISQGLEVNREAVEKYGLELTQTQSLLAETRASLSDKEKAIEKARLQHEHAESISKKMRQEIELVQREMAVIEEQRQASEREKADHQARIALLAEKTVALQEAQKQKEEERAQLQAEIEDKKMLEHQSELTAKEAEVRLESSESHLERIRQSLAEWNALQEDYRKNTQDAREEMEICSTQIVELKESQKRDGAKLQELGTQKQTIVAQTEEWLNKKAECESKKSGFAERTQGLRDAQMKLSEEIHIVELELRTFENDKNNVLQKMMENYQLSLEAALQQPLEATATPEEIAKLKKRVENMSNSVNLEAPEQYQGLEERFTFLSNQLADLQKAKDDLKVAITQINQTTREHFKETFQKVRENFIKVYASLFQGGVADLVFTDESNILETGIDIVAQPAGKKLQNIALLSGGEKTLTAIALLFAFFMVKPSPMCVLDEVDAPLDAVNVTRYLNLLKDFIHKTQFLVVTHNPRTMEACDVLYGVTMEESGVSKVISARIRKEAPAEASPA